MGGVGAELGEGSPVLEVGEGVLDRHASDGQGAVGFFPAWGERVGAAGGVAGDDHGVEDVVVQAAEAEVGRHPEACAPPGAPGPANRGPAARRWARTWSWRAADIQIRRPFSSVRARRCRP